MIRPTSILIALIATSCASTGVQKVKVAPAQENGCTLDIYTSEKELTRDYEVICLIDSKTGSMLWSRKTIAKAIDLAKPKACQCGADGIVLVSSDRKGTSLWSWGEANVVVRGIKYLRQSGQSR